MKKEQQLIIWIQNWFFQYCDGNWEHCEVIKIITLDNPGWHVLINLDLTNCEKKPFESLEFEKSEKDWYHCFVRNGKFEGAGGPCNLINILEVFKQWVESV